MVGGLRVVVDINEFLMGVCFSRAFRSFVASSVRALSLNLSTECPSSIS